MSYHQIDVSIHCRTTAVPLSLSLTPDLLSSTFSIYFSVDCELYNGIYVFLHVRGFMMHRYREMYVGSGTVLS